MRKFYQNERRIQGQIMLAIVIITTLMLYWGLFAEPTVVLVFTIPTIICELIAYLIIEKGEKKHV